MTASFPSHPAYPDPAYPASGLATGQLITPLDLPVSPTLAAHPAVDVSFIIPVYNEVDNVDAIVHSIGPGIDGLLGNTFLGRFTVTLDPAKGVLVLRPR